MGVWDLAQTSSSKEPVVTTTPRRRTVHTIVYHFDLFGRNYDIHWIETTTPNGRYRSRSLVHMTVGRGDGLWKATFRNFDLTNRYRWWNIVDPATGLGTDKNAGKTREQFTDNRRRADIDFLKRSLVFFEGDRETFEKDFSLFRVSGSIV